MTEMFEKLMNEGLEGLSLTLSEKQKEQFYQYYELLIEWNKVMNLTAITELDEVVTKHFVDSLLLLKVIPELDTQACKCIDVGTGAGFPGIPLKIAFPEVEITLADSLNKRIKFLDEVVAELGLEKVTTVHARAEELARNKEHRENYDLVVSRAVANLSTLGEYCIPFVKMGGNFISYKSGEIDEEVNAAGKAIKILGGQIKDVYKFDLSDQKRSFVNIEKIKTTPKTYPRKAGTPSKEPL